MTITIEELRKLYPKACSIIDGNEKNGKSNPTRINSYINNCIKDWDLLKFETLDEDIETYFCTCGHSIKNIYVMYNLNNQSQLIVGSECIRKLESKELISKMSIVEFKKQLDDKTPILVTLKYNKRLPDSNKGKPKYNFILRNGTIFYNTLLTIDGDRKPWWIQPVSQKCYLTIHHDNVEEYEHDSWVTMNIVMFKYEDGGYSIRRVK